MEKNLVSTTAMSPAQPPGSIVLDHALTPRRNHKTSTIVDADAAKYVNAPVGPRSTLPAGSGWTLGATPSVTYV